MRRRLPFWCALFLGGVLAHSALADLPGREGLLRFEVTRAGDAIGEHVFTFRSAGDDGLEVEIGIDLAVDFGPFTLFDYRHRNETRWQAGELIHMRSETDDNGDTFRVSAAVGPAGLLVESNTVPRYPAPRGLIPTTYWTVSTVAQRRLINTQSGELVDVVVSERGREFVPGPDGPIAATRYRMDGDLRLDLWYDDSGTLVRLAFTARGSEIVYRLVERSGWIPVAETRAPLRTVRN